MSEDNSKRKGRLLLGAPQISRGMYGDPGYTRRIYHLHATCSKAPIFRHGSRLAAWETDVDDYMRCRRDDDGKNGA
jgi:hypothetical protein